jgi:hypothetical protein
MLAVPTILGQQQITHLTPTARVGVSMSAGSPGHRKGAWVTVIAETPYDAHGIWIAVFGTWGGSSFFGNTQLVDVAVGPPGGEQVIVPNYDASCVPSQAIVTDFDPFMTFFPVYVRRGSRIAARNQSSGSGSSAWIMIALEGLPLHAPWGVGPVVDYGTNLGATRGTAVTPGVNAWGAWTLIGTTSRTHTWWTMGMDHQNDTSVDTDATYLIEIGVGPDGDQQSLGVMRRRILSLWAIGDGVFPAFLASRPIPAGTAIWARMAAATAEPRGVIVYGA